MGATIQEIGYAFLETYYHRMNKDPSKVSCLYSPTAELTHTNYQVDFTPSSDTLPTVKLTGKENISKFFTRNNKKVSDLKVKVESCDFQTTGSSHSGILILITGEMFWTGTPTYRFVQTIILAPSGYRDTFDVTNDVIRFIGDNLLPETDVKEETKEQEEEPIKEPVKETVKEPVREPVKETAREPVKEPTKEPVKEPVKESIKEPVKESSKEPEKKQELNRGQDESNSKLERQEEKEASKKESKEAKEEEKKVEEPQEDSKSQGKEPSKENSQEPVSPQPTLPQQPVRISWASKIAAHGDSSKTNTSETPYNGTAVKKPIDGKSDLSSRKDINSRTDRSDRALNKKKTVFSTVNKDGYYPIYIKGTAGIKEDRLKDTLEAEFGTVMKITNADSFAVVDFETQKSQVDALDRRQLTVDDTEVVMGRKTVKKSPSPPVGNAQTPLRPHKKHSGKKRE
ncbi:hypothetical protein ZYGR_0N07570 [Zygosaccharomyces rouxii]|uniref:UBP3-associated protein BRE5 n=1 Tax=Zygosaccharomyces rouxii TaxID=4956 RepID=B2G3V6_ZYGRO|nr:hypothetical protein ZYGR_0N07570 [Zygosaccharomyces rouxii]CAQ43265.1 UBP3-associated protein BRE5 [Zygosaccharomyces rouxii]